jgi:hypothetical protein
MSTLSKPSAAYQPGGSATKTQSRSRPSYRILPPTSRSRPLGRVPLAFDIDAFYCQPGIAGAHEKGGVEGDIGRFRRNHLVPVPSLNFVKPTPIGDGLVMITVLVSVMKRPSDGSYLLEGRSGSRARGYLHVTMYC